MIEQILIYLLCFFLGWLPLNLFFRKLELVIPFKIKSGNVKFSSFYFVYLIYLFLEFYRAFLLMEIVHQWIESDWALFIGVGVYFVGIYWPAFIPKKFYTLSWVPLVGVYGFLLPYFSWLVPILILLFIIIGVDKFYQNSLIAALFLVFGVLFTEINSFYFSFHFFLILIVSLKSYSLLKSDRISSDNFSSAIRS